MSLVSYALTKIFFLVDHAARILRNPQRNIDATGDSLYERTIRGMQKG
jgi:hypothetical protein